jgi:hypothetical protein
MSIIQITYCVSVVTKSVGVGWHEELIWSPDVDPELPEVVAGKDVVELRNAVGVIEVELLVKFVGLVKFDGTGVRIPGKTLWYGVPAVSFPETYTLNVPLGTVRLPQKWLLGASNSESPVPWIKPSFPRNNPSVLRNSKSADAKEPSRTATPMAFVPGTGVLVTGK